MDAVGIITQSRRLTFARLRTQLSCALSLTSTLYGKATLARCTCLHLPSQHAHLIAPFARRPPQHEIDRIDEIKSRSLGIKWWYDYGNGREVEGDLVHDELKRMFEPCGPVEEIIANMGPGIAYLRFENQDAMPKALEMHKTTYKGGSRNREGTLKVYAGGRVPDRSPSSARPTWRAPPFSLPRGGMPHIWKTHPWRPLHLHL